MVLSSLPAKETYSTVIISGFRNGLIPINQERQILSVTTILKKKKIKHIKNNGGMSNFV